MKNVFETVFNIVFSGTTLFVLGAIGFGYFLVTTLDKQRAQESVCYAQGMVRVRTDAGDRCALPNALVEIK